MLCQSCQVQVASKPFSDLAVNGIALLLRGRKPMKIYNGVRRLLLNCIVCPNDPCLIVWSQLVYRLVGGYEAVKLLMPGSAGIVVSYTGVEGLGPAR
jgi:hypothetical protein